MSDSEAVCDDVCGGEFDVKHLLFSSPASNFTAIQFSIEYKSSCYACTVLRALSLLLSSCLISFLNPSLYVNVPALSLSGALICDGTQIQPLQFAEITEADR
jgi:hypothetical protein